MRAHVGGLVALTLVACGPKGPPGDSDGASGESGTTDAGSSTSAGSSSAGAGGTTAPATTGPADPNDYDEMLMCSLDMVCPEFLSPVGEGPPHVAGFYDEERCILSGLRDGTPGRYIYGFQVISSTGYEEDRYLIHVRAGGEVTFAVHNRGHIDDTGINEYFPARTCVLADAAWFADCLANHHDFTYDACIDPRDWWHDCVEQGPQCE